MNAKVKTEKQKSLIKLHAKKRKENEKFTNVIKRADRKLRGKLGSIRCYSEILTPTELSCVTELMRAVVDRVKRNGRGGLFTYSGHSYRIDITSFGRVLIRIDKNSPVFVSSQFGVAW